jgi:methionine-rich copper-binding protein CopC
MTTSMKILITFNKYALVIALFLFMNMPDAARGHAFPDHSDPRVGSTVTGSPDRVRIWFDSALEPAFSSIMVHTESGAMVDKRDGRVDPADPTILEVSVPPLPPGAYHVIWSVVARDGHRTSGEFKFTVK